MNASTDDTTALHWLDWIGLHWAWAISLVITIIGVIWRAATVVSEVRAQRKEMAEFIQEYRRDAVGWRRYVDSRFDSLNGRIDNLADKD